MNNWKLGLPPNKNIKEWDVYFSPLGAIWHKKKEQVMAPKVGRRVSTECKD